MLFFRPSPQQLHVYIKNENFWDAKNVHILRIERTYNAEAGTLAPTMFLNSEIDHADISAVPSAVYYLFIQLFGAQLLHCGMLYKETSPISAVLPILSLALPSIANYAMWLRRYMVDEANKDYIKLARAKGVPNKRIWSAHVFRNSVVPMVQLIPGSLLMTISGSIYVESLYSIPGMGGLLVDVIKRQDNAMVQALVLIFAHPLHPYTRALLSAIPQPDPDAEQSKVLEIYDPRIHNYAVDKPMWIEIEPEHFVRANQGELTEYRQRLELH